MPNLKISGNKGHFGLIHDNTTTNPNKFEQVCQLHGWRCCNTTFARELSEDGQLKGTSGYFPRPIRRKLCLKQRDEFFIGDRYMPTVRVIKNDVVPRWR
jgi:hypothetical protein